jgi:1-deoxy-D-xylulose-5-phosphate reductoisomerase
VLSACPKTASLRRRFADAGCRSELLFGAHALGAGGAADAECDVLMAAIVGAAGLAPTLAGARAGKRLLLANKEALVMAGRVLHARGARTRRHAAADRQRAQRGVPVPAASGTPAGSVRRVRRIVLTASGGPFRSAPLERLSRVTPDEACAHPKLGDGRKISVDSATMMNKGLGGHRGRWLFEVPAERIEVLIHAQSIVHSLVEFVDGSVMAQLFQSRTCGCRSRTRSAFRSDRIGRDAARPRRASASCRSSGRRAALSLPGLAYAALREAARRRRC